MFKLNKIRFQNAGRFVDVQEIDFTNPGLSAVDGNNRNTNGSSGSGKSTVFMTIDYLFGCNDVPSTDLQSRLTKEPLWVEGYGTDNGKEIKIVRNKKLGLSITVGDEEISGNNKLAEAKIDEIIKIPRNLFKRLIHKKQGEGGFFLSLTNAKASEFLIECLGLKSIESKIAESLDNAKSIEKKIETFAFDIQRYQELIDENNKSKLLLHHPGEKPDSSRLDEIKGQVEKLEDILSKLNQGNKANIKKLLKEKPEEIEQIGSMGDVVADETTYIQLNKIKASIGEEKLEIKSVLDRQSKKQDALRQEIRKADHELMGFDAVESAVERYQDLAIKLKKEIDHFVVDKCPTCSQDWDAVNLLEDKKEELKTAVVNLQKQQEILLGKQKAEDNTKRLEDIRKEFEKKPEEVSRMELCIEKLQKEYAEKDNEQKLKESTRIAEYKADLAEYENKTQELAHSFQNKIQQTNNEVVKLKGEQSNIESSLSSYDNLLNMHTNQSNHYDSNIKEHTDNLAKSKKELAKETKQKDLETETARALKLYLLEVFEDTLIEIGERATDLVNNIPNMSAATIEYRGEKENKKGTIKKEICPYITLDGETVSLKTLSGGERCSADLAIDFAVEEVIEVRSGVGASWKILDEPFDGLDAVCKEQCLELISHLSRNKKVFIVDHSSETKEIFSTVTTVVRDGLYSNVVNET